MVLAPQSKHHAPQIEILNTINQWSFYQIFNFKPPCTNVKPLLMTSWRRFCPFAFSDMSVMPYSPGTCPLVARVSAS